MSRSSSSPASCPRESFTSLKRSRSTSRTAACSPSPELAERARGGVSCSASRFDRPVRESCVRAIADLGHVRPATAATPAPARAEQDEEDDERQLEHAGHRQQGLPRIRGDRRRSPARSRRPRRCPWSAPPECWPREPSPCPSPATPERARPGRRPRRLRTSARSAASAREGPDQAMVGRVRDPVAGTDDRDAQRAVDQHAAPHEASRARGAGCRAPERRRRPGAGHRAETSRRRTACPVARRSDRLLLVDLANDRENEGPGQGETDRGHDREAQHEPRFAARLPCGALVPVFAAANEHGAPQFGRAPGGWFGLPPPLP